MIETLVGDGLNGGKDVARHREPGKLKKNHWQNRCQKPPGNSSAECWVGRGESTGNEQVNRCQNEGKTKEVNLLSSKSRY